MTGEHVGATIRENRIAQNLSVSDLAKKAGISQPYLSQVERGSKPPPSEEVLVRIAAVLGIPAALLVTAKDGRKYQSSEMERFFTMQRELSKIHQAIQQIPESAFDDESLAKRYNWGVEKVLDMKETLREIRGELRAVVQDVEDKIYPPEIQSVIGEIYDLRRHEAAFIGDLLRSMKKYMRESVTTGKE